MQIRLEHTHQENYNVRTFWFKPERPINYTAGQFIELYLPHDNPDDRGIKRWFTLSSSPSDKLISITTKLADNHPSSFKRALFGLEHGAKLKFVEPMGDFVLPKDTLKPLVFVAGGIGLTPYHSMVKWLANKHEKRQIQILLAFNQSKDILFEELFKSYSSKVTVMLSNPESGWRGQVGRLSASKIKEVAGGFDGKQIYVSGPEPMVETLEKELQEAGIKKAQLVLDFFPGYRPDLS